MNGDGTRPLRVLVVMYDFSPGGAERLALRLARNLLAEGHSVILVAIWDRGHLRSDLPDGTRLLILNGQEPESRGLARTPVTIAKILAAARDSDVLLAAQDGSAAYVAASLSLVTGRPAVLWNHCDWRRSLRGLSSWHRCASRVFYRTFREIVSVTHYASREMRTYLGNAPPVLRVIYNSLPDSFHGQQRDASAGHGRMRLLCAGRLVPSKRFDLAVLAVAELVAAGHNCHLRIAGEGPEYDRLTAIVARAGLDEDHVTFLGHLSDISGQLHWADIVLVPSEHEGFGLVAIEGAAAGAAVIAFDDSGGLTEVVSQLPRGHLIPERTPSALAGAIVNLGKLPDKSPPDDSDDAFANLVSPRRQNSEWVQLLHRVAAPSKGSQ